MTRQKQQGIALLTALLITALVASIAAVISVKAQRASLQASHSLQREQAIIYALGAEDLARARLSMDLSMNSVDYPQDLWATQPSYFDLDEGRVQLHIEALDGRINLNDLFNPDKPRDIQQQRLRRLLRHLGLPNRLGSAIIDWVDTDALRGPGGAEDSAYMRLQPSYRTGNGPMAQMSELRLIEGIDVETFNILRQHVVTLPTDANLNINLASAEVLASLMDEVTPTDMRGLLDERGGAPYHDPGEFLREPAFKELKFEADQLTTQSTYFELRTLVTVGETNLTMHSLLRRSNTGRIKVIHRHFGGWPT